MLLPDHKIEDLSKVEFPLIEPFDSDRLQPASYDLSLDRLFHLGGANGEVFASRTVTLRPKQMILGCTRERIRMPGFLAGEVSGRSGNARRGIQVESAGHVDPGYQGAITLEIVNFSDGAIILTEGMGIAKIVFHMLASPARTIYNAERNRHQFQHHPTPS